jgi:hypothetical protein
MGRLWESFKEKCEELISPQKPAEPTPAPEAVRIPMRAYRQEALSDYQRKDLLEIVNLPGYEVLLDLHESTLEGFITFLVETPPEEEKKVLAMHKVCHAGYLFNRSVQQQVEVYKRIEDAENKEAKELKAMLEKRTGDPLADEDTLNKVLNPIYVSETQPDRPKFKRKVAETPLDTMLRESQ